MSNDSRKVPRETYEGCEQYIQNFLSGRNLHNQLEIDQKHKTEHDELYEKELKYDEKDREKGILALKHFRAENFNFHSKCDSQFVNNLQNYYGDGSNLRQHREKHYAMDYVRTFEGESEDTTYLKSLQAPKTRDLVKKWIRTSRKSKFLKNPPRRSVSCPPDPFREEFKSRVPDPKFERRFFDKENFYTINDLDESFRYPDECKEHDADYYYQEVSTGMSSMIGRVNATAPSVGKLEISKVLFSTEKGFAYAIPKDRNIQKAMREFSRKFKNWFEWMSEKERDKMGVDVPKVSRKRQYFERVNVVLFLPEYSEEGTEFRRARHICPIKWSKPFKELYLEIDSGELRALETTVENVRRLPQRWAQVPTPIIELAFFGAQTASEITREIEKIRETGHAYIGELIEGRRSQILGAPHPFRGKETWSNFETALVLPTRPPEKPSMSKFFCSERNCTGFCRMADFEKIEERKSESPVEETTSPGILKSVPKSEDIFN